MSEFQKEPREVEKENTSNKCRLWKVYQETGDTVIKEVGQEFSTRAAFPTSPIKCNFSLECIEDLIGVPESGEPRKSPELHATYVIPKIHYVDAKRAIESCLN